MKAFLKKYWKYLATLGAGAISLLTYFSKRDKVSKGESGLDFVNTKIKEKEDRLSKLEKEKDKPTEDLSPENVKKYWRE